MKTTKTAKNIQAINRRAATLAKLFGIESKEYQEFTARMAGTVGAPDIYVNNKGIVQIRNTKSARANYRQISALSKRVKQTPTSVLKRKAEKQQQDFYDEFEDFNDESENGFIDYNTYLKWLAQFDTYYDSCYELATMIASKDAVKYYADLLYENDGMYKDVWNNMYENGVFDAYKVHDDEYTADEFNQEYSIDENGEPFTNPDFFE